MHTRAYKFSVGMNFFCKFVINQNLEKAGNPFYKEIERNNLKLKRSDQIINILPSTFVNVGLFGSAKELD